MPMQRQRFDINAGASAVSDTGQPFTGAVVQMRWYPSTPDTGGDLAIDLMPNLADTGEAMQIYADNDCLGVPFTRVPTQPSHHADGFDTGASHDAPIYGVNERLRIRITPGGAACVGKLYVWTRD